MKVSIVTISFNQSEFLEKTILSVLEQDYNNIEYIVVDPGSTDGSRDIIEKYRSDISTVIYDPDEGPADGLNKGFNAASGDVFGFLNADDILLPGAIEKVVEKFGKRPCNADIISFNGYKIDRNGGVLGKLISNKFDLMSYVYGCCVLLQQSTFFRKEAFLAVGGFNKENRVSWDGELWFDMAKKNYIFKKYPGYISGFRIYDESITGSGDHLYAAKNVLKRHRKALKVSPEINKINKIFLWCKVRFLDSDFWFVKLGIK